MGLKSIIFNHLPLCIRVKLFEKMRMDEPCGYGEVYRVTLNKAFDTFLSPDERKDEKLMKKLTDDIVECWLKYEALPYEYFLYGMRYADDKKRSTFMTDVQKNQACHKYSGLESYLKELSDKYAFYQLMEPFFGRKVFQMNSSTDKELFVRFAMEAKSLFCKLSKGSRGKGAFAAEVMGKEDAERLFSQLTLSADDIWVVEERIQQCAAMAQWNSSSVNTVRLPTFITNSGFKVLCPCFRTGRKGAVIDNAAQGGIVVGIDPDTGELFTDGADELGHMFMTHPDSGLTFKGWQIPRWKELLEIAEKAHRVIPHQKYIGWDFALTDAGWVLIEGNWGQFIGQYATKTGVKELFMKYIAD